MGGVNVIMGGVNMVMGGVNMIMEGVNIIMVIKVMMEGITNLEWTKFSLYKKCFIQSDHTLINILRRWHDNSPNNGCPLAGSYQF